MSIAGTKGWRFTSPLLADEVLRECPTGLLLREGPYLYDAIAMHGYVQAGSVDPTKLSPWAQAAIRVVSSERARLRDVERLRNQAKSDGATAAGLVKSRRRR